LKYVEIVIDLGKVKEDTAYMKREAIKRDFVVHREEI